MAKPIKKHLDFIESIVSAGKVNGGCENPFTGHSEMNYEIAPSELRENQVAITFRGQTIVLDGFEFSHSFMHMTKDFVQRIEISGFVLVGETDNGKPSL
jgi:hypothetical protein